MAIMEIEKIIDAYNRLSRRTIEPKDVFGKTEIGLRITDEELSILRPFLEAKTKKTYSIGGFDFCMDGRVFFSKITEATAKYLVFPNERLLFKTMSELEEMIEWVSFFSREDLEA